MVELALSKLFKALLKRLKYIEIIKVSEPGRVTRSALEEGELPTGDELLEAGAFYLFPHIFVWGSCFWLCTSASPLPLPPAASLLITRTQLTTCPHTTSSHTTCPHTTCPHTTCSHTTCQHTTCTRGRRASLCVAGVALTALGGLWWRTGFSADAAVGAAALCVAGVAL